MLVKREYEQKGRLLTVVQIESKAKYFEKLEPYQTEFVAVTPPELRTAIFQIYEEPNEGGAIACDCIEEYSDTMNYHFVVDYSGSMKLAKGRAISALKDLYEKAPQTAVISITAFSTTSEELFLGRKTDMSMIDLDNLLSAYEAQGGTDPAPGVKHGLDIATRMAEGRFSHLILITDLNSEILNDKHPLKANIQAASDKIDLAVSSIAVDLGTSMDLLVSGRSQYDLTSGKFREVSTKKLNEDLFEMSRSSCDYTTQPYHYNPAKDVAKKEAKKLLKALFREAAGVGVGIITN